MKSMMLRTNIMIGLIILIGSVGIGILSSTPCLPDVAWQYESGTVIVLIIIVMVLGIVNAVINEYSRRLLKVSLERELRDELLLREATKGLYEGIYELDITHNCAGGESTRAYFSRLGLGPADSIESALEMIAGKQVEEEYRQQYWAIFSPENVIKAYESGITELSYDLMMDTNGFGCHWVRIRGIIFYVDFDQSLRMITFRQNIEEEKQREKQMYEMTQKDSLTGLYNKVAAETRIQEVLRCSETGEIHALVMIDLDDFKIINDSLGHAMGDQVIKDFTERLNIQFRESDIRGRIGGDEFVVFLKDISYEWMIRKMEYLNQQLKQTVHCTVGNHDQEVTVSIGVAFYPEDGSDFLTLYCNADRALYQSKNNGKGGCAVCSSCACPAVD